MLYRLFLVLVASAVVAGCNLSDEPTIADPNTPNNNTEEVCADGRSVCNDHGDCIEGTVASCECDPGYAGDNCESCAEGFVPEAADSDTCIEDSPLTCDDITCEGNSSCQIATSGEPACVCNDGWVGENCDMCEEGEIEFPADSGVCEDDMCADDPCAMIDNTAADSCSMPMADVFACECEDGYLWDAEAGVCEAQCEDADMDGYGDGPGCTGPDCLENDQNVQTPNQSTILSAAFTSGMATEMVDRFGQISIDADYIFTRDPNCPTCTTKLMAVYYSDNSHYIPNGNCVVAETAPAACAAGGTAGATTVNLSVPNHPGDYELRLMIVNDDQTDCAAAAAALESETDTTLGDAIIGDVQVNASTCRPGAVSLSDIRIGGVAQQRYVASPGEEIDFQADWAIAKGSCSGCVVPLAVGWTGTRAGCLYTGVPATCSGDNFQSMGQDTTLFDYDMNLNRFDTKITAPTQPGIYPLRYRTSLVFRCDVGFGSTSPFTTFGVLEVQ